MGAFENALSEQSKGAVIERYGECLDKNRKLAAEIERLREAIKKAHRALLGGSIKSLENQAAKACEILRAALHAPAPPGA